MPEFLDMLNIGQVYIAGDSLIYSKGDKLCIQFMKDVCISFFFQTTTWQRESQAERDGGGTCFNTGTVPAFNNQVSNEPYSCWFSSLAVQRANSS